MNLKQVSVRTTNAVVRSLGLRVKALNSANRISGIQIIRPMMGDPIRGAIRQCEIGGQDVRFFIENEFDIIQKNHLAGRFYEEEELAIIRRHFRAGTFVDVGANVGNHSIYAAKFLGAERIVSIEPNPDAFRILDINLLLNAVHGNAALHQIGLAKVDGSASISAPAYNLGMGRLDLSGGPLIVKAGDSILAEEQNITMIKIDTEGLEVDVIAGLTQTIALHRPHIFVEVEEENRGEVTHFCSEHGYTVAEDFRRYATSANLMLAPSEGVRGRGT